MTNPKYRQERAAYWQEQISKQAASGMTALAYCKQNALGLHTFYCWRKRLSQQQEPSAKRGKQRPVHFAVVEQVAQAQASSIQVTLRSGDRIEITAGAETAAMLETILQTLRQDVRP